MASSGNSVRRSWAGESLSETTSDSNTSPESSPSKPLASSNPATPASVAARSDSVQELKQKIRKSFRKSSGSNLSESRNLASKPPPRPWSLKLRQTSTCSNCKMLSSELDELKNRAEMLEDETAAAREAINMLHRHLDSAVGERDSLLLIHKQPNGSKDVETTLRALLAAKDNQMIELMEKVNQLQTELRRQREKSRDRVSVITVGTQTEGEDLIEAQRRELRLEAEASQWEAKYYQLHSKHMLLLSELHRPGGGAPELISRLLKDLIGWGILPSYGGGDTSTYDELGFKRQSLHYASTPNLSCTSPNGNNPDCDDSHWRDILLALNQPELHKNRHLVLQVRKGIPTKIRGQLWWAFVKSRLKPLAGHYTRLLASGTLETAAAKQIELDIVRTLPGHRHFGSTGAAGVGPLRRVLLAYSRHDPEVGYCQGLNRLAAVLLLCLGEEEAFWALVCIVTCLMPSGYYTAGLEGARADLLTLQDLIQEKLPILADHLSRQGAEAAPLALGWLLCAFADCLPPSTYLRVWDSFLLEGHKVLLRFALALFRYAEEEVLRCEDAGSSLECLQRTACTVLDADSLSQIAFHELNPFSQKTITAKREKHLKVLKEEAANKARMDSGWSDDPDSTLGNSLGKRTWSTGPE